MQTKTARNSNTAYIIGFPSGFRELHNTTDSFMLLRQRKICFRESLDCLGNVVVNRGSAGDLVGCLSRTSSHKFICFVEITTKHKFHTEMMVTTFY